VNILILISISITDLRSKRGRPTLTVSRDFGQFLLLKICEKLASLMGIFVRENLMNIMTSQEKRYFSSVRFNEDIATG